MDSLFGDFLKLYGPLAMGWVLYGWSLTRDAKREERNEARLEKDIESRNNIAVAMSGLAQTIRDRK